MSSHDPTAGARKRFAALAAGSDASLDVEEGALLIAAEAYPSLDLAAVREELDALARGAARCLRGERDTAGRIRALLRFLCDEEGFRGARGDYYDPRNSYLNDVIARRRGIPITLSLVTMAVGRRVGLDVRGIPFPGHFLAKCVAGDQEWIVDAFEGCIVSRAACEARLSAAAGRPVRLRPELHLRSASPREILVRMLTNLARIFAERGDLERLLGCCDRILLLTPGDPLALRDRALIYERLGWLAAAAADLDTALARLGDDPLGQTLRARRDALRGRMGPLH